MKIVTMLIALLVISPATYADDVKSAYDQWERVNESPYSQEFQKTWAQRDPKRAIVEAEDDRKNRETFEAIERIKIRK